MPYEFFVMSNGWAKIHRQIEDNPLYFSEPFTKAQAWMDLFIFANHKDGSFWVRGIEIPLKRGQIGWSELTMAERWRWSREKVRRFLRWLETRQQIRQQKVAKITTIITILNYDRYQNDTTDETTNKQQKDNRRDTNKNVKKNKNEKNIISDVNVADPINQIFDIFYRSINPNINFGNTTSREAANWMVSKYGLEKTVRMAEYACEIHGQKYAPVITTPYQLKESMSKLIAHWKQNQSNKIVEIPNI